MAVIWKRQAGASIDVRRQREESGPLGRHRRLALLAALALMTALALASMALEILATVQPRELPFEVAFFAKGWMIESVTEPSQGLRAGDRILAVAGAEINASRVASDQPQARSLWRSARGVTTTTFTLQRGEEEIAVEVSTAFAPWNERLADLSVRMASLFVLLVAFLALRSRSRDASAWHLGLVCLLFSFDSIKALPDLWLKWTNPFFWNTPLWESWGDWDMGLGLALSLVFFAAFLRFLHVFPTYDRVLAQRFAVPRLVWVVAVLVAFFGVFYKASEGSENFADAASAAFIVCVFATLISLLVLASQILHLGRERLRGSGTGEKAQQAKMGLLGIQLGLLAFFAALILLPVGMLVSNYADVRLPLFGRIFFERPSGASFLGTPVAQLAAVVLSVTRDILGEFSLVLPFVGIFLAIVRRGLWDVDLILKRATVYSVLTVLFVVGLLCLEVTIENVLPGRFFGVPWIDNLGVAALAAGVVAVSHRWVKSGLTRRFFPESINFDCAIEEVSEDVATAETEASPGAYLGERLTAALGASPCAVLVRLGKNLFQKVWSTGETAPTALVAGAASTALETNPSAIVMTDEGPVLAARIGKGESYPGLLLLGPRRGGRFYSTEERRLLTPLLNQAALLLKQST